VSEEAVSEEAVSEEAVSEEAYIRTAGPAGAPRLRAVRGKALFTAVTADTATEPSRASASMTMHQHA